MAAGSETELEVVERNDSAGVEILETTAMVRLGVDDPFEQLGLVDFNRAMVRLDGAFSIV